MAKEEKEETVELVLPFTVIESALMLRTPSVTAKCEDGREVEVATNIDGSVLVTVNPAKRDGEPVEGAWRTYSITPRQLIEAVLKQEDKKPRRRKVPLDDPGPTLRQQLGPKGRRRS